MPVSPGRALGLALAAALRASHASGADLPYDPLRVQPAEVPTADFTVPDAARGREIPVRVYLPARAGAAAAVVLFSHGLGGSREGSAFLGRHWAARGYAAVFVQHPGSDDSVWRDAPDGRRMAAMREAASIPNFLARAGDVRVVLDRLEAWNGTPGHPLAGRLDLSRIGMSGHSFGAITTQAVCGESFPGVGTSLVDKRLKAAVVFSPSAPRVGSAAAAFGGVALPWLLATGTKDVAPIGDADVASRRAVFTNLPPGGKYEVVLDGAEHSAFTDRALPWDTEPRNPNHHRAVLALSTAFWDAHLKGDAAARAWLDGDGPRTVLEKKDVWQRK